MRLVLKVLISILIPVVLAVLLYNIARPIPFLYIVGIVLSFIYVIVAKLSERQKKYIGPRPDNSMRLLSVLFLVVLFCLSLKVLKDYQAPRGKAPYFNNLDYHALANYGVAFSNSIDLYSEKEDSVSGIWPSMSGKYKIAGINGNKATMEFDNFLVPVFSAKQIPYCFLGLRKKTKFSLLNPVYKESIVKGFKISDSQTSLTWIDISSKESNIFTFMMVFETSDRYLFDADFNTAIRYRDTILVKDLELQRGLSLKSIISRDGSFNKITTSNILFRWLDRYQGSYLINDGTGLLFFPSNDFYNACKVYKGDKLLAPTVSTKTDIDIADRFFVGLENERKKMQIRSLTVEERKISRNENFLLEFVDKTYFPFKSLESDESNIGVDKLRFLKNNYKQLTYNEIREGFLFHEETKQNSFTEFDGLIKFRVGSPNTKLQYEVISKGKLNPDLNMFALPSKNSSLVWLFSIEDFSKNPYAFSRLIIYLGLLVILMIALVLFKPNANLSLLETPLLIIVYLFIVFRFLLLWRVATFPPLENISSLELSKVRFFDVKGSISISWVIAFLALFVVLVIRKGSLDAFAKVSSQRGKSTLRKITLFFFNSRPVLVHFFVLVFFATYQKIFGEQVLLNILVPISSYFALSYVVIEKQLKLHHAINKSNNYFLSKTYDYLAYWIETPIFLLSLLTLGYYAVFDTGFAVLFLFFLIFKTILFSFYRKSVINRQVTFKERLTDPRCYWIYAVIALCIYVTAIFFKKSFYYALEYKFVVLIVLLTIVLLAVYFLMDPERAGKVKITSRIKWKLPVKPVLQWLLIFALIILIVPNPIKFFIGDGIDYKTRLTKFRTAILTDPVENMLFDYKYNSGKEQKIIETAQGQWFINTYLNLEQDKRLIHLREHFDKGVDYTTQTRDVVVPRYIISEFGGFSMFMILISLIFILLIFFLNYRISGVIEKFDPSGYLAGMSLILLPTIATFVWLTSTNRFVFFGQDFPFLSLTSKLSTALPMLLVTIVLFTKPVARDMPGNRSKVPIYGWVVFVIFLGLVVVISGKSNVLNNERFKVDFSKVLNRVDSVNYVLGDIQSTTDKNFGLSSFNFKNHSEKFISGVQSLMDSLFTNDEFKEIYDRSTVYEKSIFDSLKVNPALGFKSSSPIHIRFDSNKDMISFSFNQYFHLEQPPYDIKKVWKGDIEEQVLANEDRIVPKVYDAGSRKIILIPSSFLAPNEKPFALLYVDYSNKDECHIYNKQDEHIRQYQHQYAVAKLTEQDVVLFLNKKQGVITPWTMYGDKHYFAYSMMINGRQRHIYPLGSLLYWARDWKDATKQFLESTKAMGSNTFVDLDFNLCKRVNTYLQGTLKNAKKSEPELSFSVVAADGNGQIRLMADWNAQREIIDPNDERKIALKKSEQYFNVDSRAERIQWGNTNLLHMDLGPGSSIKPIVATAVTSGLKLEWQDLNFVKSEDTLIGEKFYTKYYAGLKLPGKGWEIGKASNYTNISSDFRHYLSESNNWYHSLIVFLGSYNQNDFLKNGNYSLRNQLSTKPNSNSKKFPIISVAGTQYYFLNPDGWPATSKNSDGKISYFGSGTSLIANGLRKNFFLTINPTNRYNSVVPRDSISEIVPDSITNKNTWSSPEASYFFQDNRVSDSLTENFNNGLRNPTLGGSPYVISPIAMLEMYGKLAAYNRLFKVTVDKAILPVKSEIDPDSTWGKSYPSFLLNNIYEGMRLTVTQGTARRLTNGNFIYKGYFVYAKTGTIGNSDDENSKRLAIIVTKAPFSEDNLSNNKFYVVYFTIGHAFESDEKDKSWFWPYYKIVLDEIINSTSFKTYMK